MSKLDFLPKELETFPRKSVAIAYEDGSLAQINDLMQLPTGEQVRVVDMLEDDNSRCLLIDVGDYFDYFSIGEDQFKLIRRDDSFAEYPLAEEVARHARQGDFNAMFHLYSMMEYGNGIQKNREISHQIKKQAAKSGHGPSYYHLGSWQSNLSLRHTLYLYAAEIGYIPAMRAVAWHFEIARGVEKDELNQNFWRAHANGIYKMGVSWEEVLDARIAQLRLAPEDCDRESIFKRAMEILISKEDKKDILLAIELLEMSASAGYGSAQMKLAELYLQGHLVRQNKEAASSFFAKVAESDDGDAVGKLAQRYADGKDAEQNSTYAIQLWQRAAELGDRDAQYALGNQYQQGEHLEKNVALAFSFFECAAKQKHPMALFSAGLCLESGTGAEVDMEKAAVFFQESADLKCTQAILKMAELFEAGNVVENNPEKAFSLYKIAADVYHIAQAKFKVAYMYEHGIGVAQQYKEAVLYYDSCYLPESYFRLGLMHKMGLGTMENRETARGNFECALQAGHVEAMHELELLSIPAEYEIESDHAHVFWCMFYDVDRYEGDSLWEDVILKKWERFRDARQYFSEQKNRKCAYKPWPPTTWFELDALFHAARTNESLISLLHPENPRYRRTNLTLDKYISLFEHVGFDIHWPTQFHPFHCEVVEVEQTEGGDIEIVETLWPEIMLGNLMFSRAGVRVRAPTHLLTKGIADRHCLYWCYVRDLRTRSCHESDSDSIEFRRDFDLGDRYAYNVDGGSKFEITDLTNPFEADFVDSDLSVEERISLLRYRCAVNVEYPNFETFWPYEDYYEEVK
ncbi:SEL1-like repeat protein [Undibacterium sp. Ji83W]|uniref:SEL1-like repeat protein n=1 Tax=Undibacterium sp. Ji83W TaxID=3413043 RepID=UPI003BF42C70